jgi:hypothetical protein
LAIRRRYAAEVHQQHILIAPELAAAAKVWEFSNPGIIAYQSNALALQTRAYITHLSPDVKALDISPVQRAIMPKYEVIACLISSSNVRDVCWCRVGVYQELPEKDKLAKKLRSCVE